MKRSSFSRPIRTHVRPLQPKIAIASEGKCTEPKYFNDIRLHLQASQTDVVLVPHAGTDPLSIVEAMVIYLSTNGKHWQSKDQAWAVFDGEEHWQNAQAKNRWIEAIQLAHKHKIRLAISNPSFELWYLLHFQPQAADLNRDAAVAKLKAHVLDYDKSASLFPMLHPKVGKNLTSDAIPRAAALCGQCSATGWEQWRNPSTGVGELVSILLSLAQ